MGNKKVKTERLNIPLGIVYIRIKMSEENKALGKLNQQGKKRQMMERRKTSFWLNAKLTELEEKHLSNKGGIR